MAIKSKDSTKWQIISHVALMFFALCALIPFLLLLSASFNDERSVMV